MTEQLKPCHCGKEPILHPHYLPGYAVTCSCGLCTVPFGTREEAIECWNHRPEEDRLRAIVEAQKEVIAAQKEVIGAQLWFDECDEALRFLEDKHGVDIDGTDQWHPVVHLNSGILVNAIEQLTSARTKLAELEKA